MSPEKAARQAANILMLAHKRIRLADNSDMGHFRNGPSGTTFFLDDESLDDFGRAARKLVPFIDLFPVEKCVEHLADFVLAERDAGTPLPQVQERLRVKISDFLNGFGTPGEWELLLAVRGINSTEGPFTLGQCRFLLMDNNQFDLWGRRYSSGQYAPPKDARILQSWAQYEVGLLGQAVAVARVRATDADHARTKGKIRIEESLNVLRFSQLAISSGFGSFPEVGLSKRQYFDNHCIVMRLDKAGCSTSKSGSDGVSFPPSMLQHAPGWSELERVVGLDTSARTELQLRLTTALEWIGQAALAPSSPIRLVALVTALEALLIDENESTGKKTKLARRVSKLLATSDTERQRLVKNVEEVYRTRSECVHAALVDVEKAEIDKAVELVAKTVEAILTCHSHVVTLKDLLGRIDRPSVQVDGARTQWIAMNAYLRWLNEGRLHGREDQHWLDAEREYICTTVLRDRPLATIGADRKDGDD